MHNPLEQFQINVFLPIHIGRWDISLTNAGLTMILTTLFIIGMSFFMTRKLTIVPSVAQTAFETLYDFIEKMVKDTIGDKGKNLTAFVLSLFLFIFVGNLWGLFPYAFTFTSHLSVVGMLALIGFVLSMVLGVKNKGLSWFRVFFPKGIPWALSPIIIPIEILSFLSKPFSLTVRLVMNMIVGHIMLEIAAGFVLMLGFLGIIPLLFTGVLILFEVFIGFLQAYIYSILTCIYLSDAYSENH